MGRVLVVLSKGLGRAAWGCGVATTIFLVLVVTEPGFLPAVVEIWRFFILFSVALLLPVGGPDVLGVPAVVVKSFLFDYPIGGAEYQVVRKGSEIVSSLGKDTF